MRNNILKLSGNSSFNAGTVTQACPVHGQPQIPHHNLRSCIGEALKTYWGGLRKRIGMGIKNALG
eukprot:7364599-Karenia_brevis.AAC.1